MLGTAGSPPSWASGISSDRERSSYDWAPQLQQAQPQTQTQPELDYAEPSLATFEFAQTQSTQDAEYARNATLPPLESVLELTDAVRPPLRGEEPQMASTSSAGVCGCAYILPLQQNHLHPTATSSSPCSKIILTLQRKSSSSACAQLSVDMPSLPLP